MSHKAVDSIDNQKIREVMEEYKEGTLKSGPGGKAGRVKSRKQAAAIALSEARTVKASIPGKTIR